MDSIEERREERRGERGANNVAPPEPGPIDIIFQDGFETDPSDWGCLTNGSLNLWQLWDCGNHYPDGRGDMNMVPGRNGGNAVAVWKNNTVPNGYYGEQINWLTGDDIKTELYHRWYMRVPPASEFNKQIAEGFKFWRYILREQGYGNPPELYLNASGGGDFASSNLVLLNAVDPLWSLYGIANFNDNQWHCHEIRIVINSSPSNADGILQYWHDGVLRATHNNIIISRTASSAVHRFGVGIGNVSDSPWYQSAWSNISFDDVVLATEYIGPDYVIP